MRNRGGGGRDSTGCGGNGIPCDRCRDAETMIFVGLMSGPPAASGAAPGRRRAPAQRSTSPAMNFSTRSRQTSSGYCSGGDFMK
jgi:hypothetical protein